MARVPAEGRLQRLVADIGRLYVEARQAQVRFAWETGRRIVEEEQDGSIRAAYGAALIRELSAALSARHGPGFSVTNLARMRKFYLLNQKVPAPTKLDWAAYVELLPVPDARTRQRLAARALKDGLNSRQLRRLVRGVRQAESESGPAPSPKQDLPPLTRPTGLRLNTFARSPLRVKLNDGAVLVDCGFFVNWPVRQADLAALDLQDGMSYTYAATIDRVVDGDTLLVLIAVGFGIIVRDRLRLRGINCPEAGTPEGQRAKKFVERLLLPGSTVVIQSHKCRTDRYGRFVADVFYAPGVADAARILGDAVYLNQQLLDRGHAVRLAE